MKKYPARLKLLLLCASAAIGALCGAYSYAKKYGAMTPWQQSQKIDFENGTGSTKFKAAIDACTNGALAFGIAAAAGAAALKMRGSSKK